MQDWEYQWAHIVTPILNDVFSPSVLADAPSTITLWQSGQVYTVVYNIMGSSGQDIAEGARDEEKGAMLDLVTGDKICGTRFLQDSLDRYLAGVCRTYLSHLVVDKNSIHTFLARYLDAFSAYKRCIIDVQLRTAFSYLERQHNSRIRSDNYGWFAKPEHADLGREDRETLQIKELQERYGLPVQTWTERDRRRAERRAETLSGVDTPVGLQAMGMRRWRVEVTEPLLKMGEDGENVIPRAVKHAMSARTNEKTRGEVLRRFDQALEDVGVDIMLCADVAQISRI